ncbi:hypothetical protein [Streptomyces sp. NPDC093225]|uniref:hypothetical protein n=1 Tax=Streptomyces sp. NPDC093225 TaxID=3366034 RepID=UPI0038273138
MDDVIEVPDRRVNGRWGMLAATPFAAARAVVVWAAAYAGLGLGCAVTDTPAFRLGPHAGPVWLGWAAAGFGGLVAVAGATVLRYGARPWLRWSLWGLCAAAGAAAFGLLMDLVAVLSGAAPDGWASAGQHAWAAVGALVLAGAARGGRGPERAAPGGAEVGAPPRRVRVAAWGGTAAFLPYAAMKTVWAVGGTFGGITGAQLVAEEERNGASGLWLTLASWGIDFTALLAGLGVFLLWGLVRPWGLVFPRWVPVLRGRRVPRSLPLVPAVVGAATLAPYGVLGVGYLGLASAGVVTLRRGDMPSAEDALLVSWVGIGAFAVYGVALVVAARWYAVRTRPGVRGGSGAPAGGVTGGGPR